MTAKNRSRRKLIKDKGFGIISFLLLLLVVGIAVQFGFRELQKRSNNASQGESAGLVQDCPDEWIDNQMPRVAGDNRESEYFIIDGKRHELAEYDVQWIREHCTVKKPTIVY